MLRDKVGRQHRDHRLLLGRLSVSGEHDIADCVQVAIRVGRGRDEGKKAIVNRRALRQPVQIFSRARILSFAPSLHLRIVAVFQPAIGVHDLHMMVSVRNRHLLRYRCAGIGGMGRGRAE